MYRIPWVPQLLSLSFQTVSFGISSGVVIPDVPSLDAVSYLIPYMCGIVSRRHSLFLQGPVLYGYPSVVVSVCRHRLSHCGLDWECMLLEWIGVYTWLVVCVTVTLRVHTVVCYHSTEWVVAAAAVVSQWITFQNTKSTILLLLCFSSPSLKPASADTPSRFTPLPLPFLIIIFWAFGYLLLSLLLNISLSLSPSLSLLELGNSSNGSWNRRSASAAPRTCRNNK